jgi:hypothetical protein
LVAAITRQRAMRSCVSPTRWNSPFSSTRSSFACSSEGQLADLIQEQRAVLASSK